MSMKILILFDMLKKMSLSTALISKEELINIPTYKHGLLLSTIIYALFEISTCTPDQFQSLGLVLEKLFASTLNV